MKISTVLYLVLLVVLVSTAAFFARFGWRCHQLKKAMPTAAARYRVAMVPKDLDLSAVRVDGGQLCDVGYAEFVVPASVPLQLMSIKEKLVKGIVGSASFFFLPPFMDNGTDLAAISCIISGKSDLQQNYGATIRSMDHLFQIEQVMPLSRGDVMTMRTPQFSLYLSKLISKANREIGYGGVYTFATPEIRGYLMVGEKPDDLRVAQVNIHDLTGTLSVGGWFTYPPGTKEDILDFLKPVLASFRFKVHTITSDDQLRKLITDAGIKLYVSERSKFDVRAYYRAHH